MQSRTADGPRAGVTHGALHREHAPFPSLMERRLVGLDFDFAEAVHPAHVVDAVGHARSADLGKPVPIIESRVTSAASSSALKPAVPDGRIGSTR